MRVQRIMLVLLVITGMAVSCETEVYEEPNDLTIAVELVELQAEGAGAVTITIDVVVPDGIDRGVEWLKRAELSVRDAGGRMEYLRVFFDPEKGPFGVYLAGGAEDPKRSRDATSLWGALLGGGEEQTVVSYVEGERYVEDDGKFRLTWEVSLFDVPLGEYEVFARAVPIRQRDRPFVSIGWLDLGVESLEDAGERRPFLEEVLRRGTVVAGDTEFTVEELWGLFQGLVARPDVSRGQIGRAGELSFVRFLYLLAVWGTQPAPGGDSAEPALPDIDIAAAAFDPDPWIAAPALFLARKWQVELDEEELAATLVSTTWDTDAADQARLYLRGDKGSLSTCALYVYVADQLEDWEVRYQYPTPRGLEISTPDEPFDRLWDGAMPLLVEPGEYRVSYLAGDPPVHADGVQAECVGGGSTRIVLWRSGGI